MKVLQLELDDAALAARISDLLFERGDSAAAIEPRRHEEGYQVLLGELRELESRGWDRVERVVIRLLDASKGWPVEVVHRLMSFIEEAGFKAAVPELRGWAESGTLLALEEGKTRHAMVLRTLLGLGWLGSPIFWDRQARLLAGENPELIFRGLVLHGLDFAFQQLHRLVPTPEAMRRVLRLFPSLVERHSMEKLAGAARRTLSLLDAEAAAVLTEWFAARCSTLEGPELPDDLSEIAALDFASLKEGHWQRFQQSFLEIAAAFEPFRSEGANLVGSEVRQRPSPGYGEDPPESPPKK